MSASLCPTVPAAKIHVGAQPTVTFTWGDDFVPGKGELIFGSLHVEGSGCTC